VIPEVPVRQWVLSLPYRVRLLCAYDPDVCARMRRILVRAVSGYYESAARRLGLPRPLAGAVAFSQRFDSALRINLHFHVLWLDGVGQVGTHGSQERVRRLLLTAGVRASLKSSRAFQFAPGRRSIFWRRLPTACL